MKPIIKHGLIGVGSGIALYLLIHKHCTADQLGVDANGLVAGGGGAPLPAGTLPPNTATGGNTVITTNPSTSNPNDTNPCPDGYTLIDGVCKKNVDANPCPDGYTLVDGVCKQNTDTTGTTGTTGTTTAPTTPTCPAGYTYEAGSAPGSYQCVLIDTSQAATKPARIFHGGGSGRTLTSSAGPYDPNAPGTTTTNPRGTPRAGARPTEIKSTSTTATTSTTAATSPTATNTRGSIGARPGVLDMDGSSLQMMDDARRNYMLGFSKRHN